MRLSLLKVSIILLNVVCLAALGYSVFAVFFSNKVDIKPKAISFGHTFTPAKAYLTSSTLKDSDLNSLDSTFSAVAAFVAANKGDDATAQEDTKPAEPEETTEVDDFVIIGVVLDNEIPEDSLAVIFDRETGEQVNVFIGDEYKGWTLELVMDRITVMLVKGDVSIKLAKVSDVPTMKDTKVVSNQPSIVPDRKSKSRNDSNSAAIDRIAKMRNASRDRNAKSQWNNRAVNGKIKKSFSKAKLKEMVSKKNQLMQEVYAKPFYDGDKAIGMQVTSLVANSELNEFGLQVGDIVTSWNGTPITSEATCYALMRQYESDVDSVPEKNTIVVIRNGERVVLEVDVK